MTVHLIGGQKLQFAFQHQLDEEDTISSVAAIRKGLDSHQIVLEADGKLVVIPGTAISYMEFNPAPLVLPTGILRGAKRI